MRLLPEIGGSHELTFEQFAYYNIDSPEYDPSLWTVIWDGEEVAAFSINNMRMGIGWLHTPRRAPHVA